MKKKFLSLMLVLSVLIASAPCIHAAKVSSGVKKVVAGCALLEDGSVWTWGSYSGDGTYDGTSKPQKIMENVKDIYEYNNHYALKDDNSLWGWGGSHIGDGTMNTALIPTKIADDVKEMCSEGFFIKTDNSLWGWGIRIGDGTEADRLSPVKICDDVKETYLNQEPRYIIKNDDSLWGWGLRQIVESSSYIGIGDGTDNTRLSPVKIMDDVRSISITWCDYDISVRNNGASGYMQINPLVVFAIKNDNTLWGWGANKNGQLIDGTTDYKQSPVKVMDNVKEVKAAERFGRIYTDQWYIIKTDNTLWGWGDNADGVLGIGAMEESYVSTPVKIMDDVAEVYPYEYAVNFAKKTDNSLWGWGCNDDYALGMGKKDAIINTPQKILDNVTYFSCDHIPYNDYGLSYAIDNEGKLYNWGISTLKSTYYYSQPTRVTSNVKKVFNTHNFCDYYIKDNSSLWGRGGSSDNPVGDGTEIRRYDPVQILFDDANDVTQPPTLAVDKTSNSSDHTFNVTLSRPFDGCYVYAAVYDSVGNLINANKVYLNTSGSTSVSVPRTSSDKTAKIFVWTKNMQPITEAKSVEL